MTATETATTGPKTRLGPLPMTRGGGRDLRRLGDLNPGRARTLTALAVPSLTLNRAASETMQANPRRSEPVRHAGWQNLAQGAPVRFELAMSQHRGLSLLA